MRAIVYILRCADGRTLLIQLFSLIAFFVFSASAEAACLSAEQAQMPQAPDAPIPGTPFSAAICYLPEGRDHYYRDRIELREGARVVARAAIEAHITGRIDELSLAKHEGRFAAFSYQAGEFCNGIVIFDLRKRRALQHVACVSNHRDCAVAALSDKACRAELICKDNGGDAGDAAPRERDMRKNIELCR